MIKPKRKYYRRSTEERIKDLKIELQQLQSDLVPNPKPMANAGARNGSKAPKCCGSSFFNRVKNWLSGNQRACCTDGKCTRG